MSWRILTDENVEPATRNYLKKLGHDIEHVVTVDALGQSVSDAEIAEYARRTDRVILTQDNDFFLRTRCEARHRGRPVSAGSRNLGKTSG